MNFFSACFNSTLDIYHWNTYTTSLRQNISLKVLVLSPEANFSGNKSVSLLFIPRCHQSSMSVPEDKYPKWPEGENGTRIFDMVGLTPIDNLFRLIYVEDKFQARFNDFSDKKNYLSSGWVPSYTDLPAIGTSITATEPPSEGFVRRVTYSGQAMGSKFQGEDLQVVLAAEPGQKYLIEVCVGTTAPYGDKFRVIVRHILQSLGENRTSIQIVIAPNFLSKVNGIVKSMIEKGIRDGTTKNFAAVKTVLQDFIDVEEPTPPEPTVTPVETVVEEENAVFKVIVGDSVHSHAKTYAILLSEVLKDKVPVVGELSTSVYMAVLSAAVFLMLSRLVIDMILFASDGSQYAYGRIASIIRALFAILDHPRSVNQLLTSLAIALFVRGLANRVISWIPTPPPSQGDACGSAKTNQQNAQDADGEGIRYEGYSEAIAVVADRFQKGAAGFGSAMRAIKPAGRRGRRDAAKTMLKESFIGLKASVCGQSTSDTSKDVPPSSQSPPLRKRDFKKRAQLHKRSQSREYFLQHQAQAGTLTPDGGSTPKEFHRVVAPALSEGATPMSSPPAELAHFSADPTDSKTDEGSKRLGRMIASKLNIVIQEKQDQQSRAYCLIEVDSDGEFCDSTPSNHTPFVSGAEREMSRVVDLSDLPHRIAAHAVTEEVFENERLQPFRGWGHTWPGHFLPTDKVHRWTQRDDCSQGPTPSVTVTSQHFRKAAPRLPDGWQWVESAWQLDLSGVLIEAIDRDGWSYGLDFSKVVYPFARGSGHKGLTDFVRRRRFFRTRVPSYILQEDGQIHVAEPGFLVGSMLGKVDSEVARSKMSEAMMQGMMQEEHVDSSRGPLTDMPIVRK